MLFIITFMHQSVSHTHSRSSILPNLFNNDNIVEVMVVANVFEDYSVPDMVTNTLYTLSHFILHHLVTLTLLSYFYRLGNWDIERFSNLSRIKLLISEEASIHTQVFLTLEPEFMASKHCCKYKYILMWNIICLLKSCVSCIAIFVLIFFLYSSYL